MSNTSTSNDKTVGDDAKVKLIIGEIGRDTKTGIIGRGYSFDNGRTFHVTDTIYGRLYDDRDVDGVWNNGMHEKVKEKVNQEITNTVEPAIKQADSAVAYANDAIEKSRVNQQAIEDINSAVSDAVSDAAVARSDGLRAWDAAQSNVDLIDLNYASASAAISSARTEAIAAADEAKKSASAAQANIVAVRSDVAAVQADVTATKSDVAAARAGAQSDVAAVRADVTATKSDVAAIRADVTANKSDAAVVRASMASDVAVARADAASNKSDISAMRANVASDIAAVQADAKALTSQIADITSNGGGRNLAIGTSNSWKTKQDNDKWNAVTICAYTNAQAGDVFTVSADTKSTKTLRYEIWQGSSATVQNKRLAGGDHEAIASGTTHSHTTFTWPSGATQYLFVRLVNNAPDGSHASYQYKNAMLEKGTVAHDWQPAPEDTGADIAAAKSDIAVVRTNLASQATSLSSYAAQASAAGQDITMLKSQAGQFEQEMADTKGDVSQLKVSASSASAALSDAAGNISSLQASAKSYSAALSDTNSNVATVTATASELETKYADAAGDINKLQTDAKGTTQALTNAKSDIAVLQSRADGFDAEFVSANGNINKLQTDAKGTAQTLVDAKDDIAKLKVRADGFDTEFANTSGDINKLQADAKGTTQTLADAQDDIAKLKTRADGFDAEFSSTNGDINKLQTDASGAKQTLTNAQSDIAVLQSRADGFDTKYADAAGDISTLQASAKSYSAALSDAKGDIATVKATASELETKYADAAGDINKLQTDAKGTTQTLADAQDDIAKLKIRADGFDTQFSSTNGNINKLQTDASGAKQTLTNAESDIAVLQSRADGYDTKFADTAGDISTLQASAKSYSAALSDAKGDIATVKATASELETKYADAAGDINKLQTDAKGMTQTISNTQGDIAKLKIRADGFDTQFSSTNGDISKLQTDASGTKQTLTNAKSDIAVLQSRADGFDAKYADTAGDINTIKADAKGMTQTLADAKGDIAKLKTRADGFDTEFASTNGDISKLQTDASGTKQTLTNAKSDIAVLQSRADGFDAKYADVAGNINTIKVNAKGMQQTLTNAKGDISTLQATATGFKNTLTDAQGNISTLQSDVSGLKKTTSDHAGNIATLQASAKTLTSQMSSAQGDISTLKQTASGFSSKVSGMETSLANANNKIDGITSNGGGRNLAIGTSNSWKTKQDNDKWNAVTICAYTNAQAGDVFTVSADTKSTKALRYEIWQGSSATVQNKRVTGGDHEAIASGTTHSHTTFTWPSGATQYLFVRLVNNAPDGSHASYQYKNAMLEKGIVAHDWSPAPEDTDAKITTNTTAIEQTKKAITLKADQTTVDKTNGDVKRLQSRLKIQSDQINAKVSSSDLQNLVGKGGRNLLIGSDPTLSNKPSLGGVTEVTVDGVKAWESNNTDNIMFNNISLEANTTYTYSALIKADTAGGLGFTRYGHFQVKNPNAHNQADPTHEDIPSKRDYHGITVPANQWTRIYYTFTTNDLSGSTFGVYPSHANGHVYIRHLMLEKGMIAHDYQPAPEDVQTYTQTQIKQTADSWNANLTSVKDGLTKSYTNLHATVDGIQAQVYNKDGSSRITQLSNLIATKVSSGDYNSQITQLKNDINLRVAKGNVVSQINQEAGGNTLIQVSNGQGKLALNASSVIFSGSAFIPDAYITTLNADKLRFYDSSGNVATMSAGLQQYDDDKTKRSIVLKYSGGYEVHASDLLGSILTMHDNTIRLAVKAIGADTVQSDQYSGFYASQHYAQLSCYRSDGKAPGIFITDDGYTIKGDYSGNGTKYGDLNITSPQIYVQGGNSVAISGGNAVQMQVNNTHAWLSDSMLHLYKDGDSSSSATELKVDGWAWINGWVEAAGHSQHSALSTKTEIQSVDDEKMLKMVNDTDLATFLYKTDVANGETHRHIGLIIDDVHDVAQYQTPQEFIAPNGVSRDDDNMIGALFGAVKALTKRIKTLESKVG